MLATELRDLRIGYVPTDPSLRQPTDRRRFCFWASRRGLKFEIADPARQYDLVVMSPGGDISVWQRYRGNARIIYQQIDSYLAGEHGGLKASLRGLAKFAVRQNRHLLLDYNQGIRDMCRRADAVICSTPEQEQVLRQFCANVHAILDFHESEARSTKSDYRAGEVFHFVWEGLAGNLWMFREIAEVLRKVRSRRRFLLHLVTDLEFGQFLNARIWKRRSADVVRRVFGPLAADVRLYQWEESTAAAIMTACDLALIPIDLRNPLLAGKPENKLLLLWRLGIPVLTSATPAYLRTMQSAGVAMTCADTQDWREALERYMVEEEARAGAAQRGQAYVRSQYSTGRLLEQWDAAVASAFESKAEAATVGAR